MFRATWYEGTAQLLSLTELKSHLFELYFVGWIIKPMKEGRKPEYPEKTAGDELQKMLHTTARRLKPQTRLGPAQQHWWQARKADMLTVTPRVAGSSCERVGIPCGLKGLVSNGGYLHSRALVPAPLTLLQCWAQDICTSLGATITPVWNPDKCFRVHSEEDWNLSLESLAVKKWRERGRCPPERASGHVRQAMGERVTKQPQVTWSHASSRNNAVHSSSCSASDQGHVYMWFYRRRRSRHRHLCITKKSPQT